MDIKGYVGNILRVNLNDLTFETEDTTNYRVDKFLGGRGLGVRQIGIRIR